jgi:hypothetical protein
MPLQSAWSALASRKQMLVRSSMQTIFNDELYYRGATYAFDNVAGPARIPSVLLHASIYKPSEPAMR